MKKYFLLVITCILFGAIFTPAFANSPKRIEVYTISQHYWDVVPGETLSAIVKQLLPNNLHYNLHLRKKLLSEIVALNPNAFSLNNPDNLKANIRLWLPNHFQAMRGVKNRSHTEIKSFSWGQVYKAKR